MNTKRNIIIEIFIDILDTIFEIGCMILDLF